MEETSLYKHESFYNGLELQYPKSFQFMKWNTIFVKGSSGVEIAAFINQEERQSYLFFNEHLEKMPQIYNVVDFDIWIKNDGNWTLIRKNWHLLDFNDLKDIYVAAYTGKTEYYDGEYVTTHRLYLYHNSHLEKLFENISEYKAGQDLKIYYIQKSDNYYFHYIYKRGNSELLLKDSERFSYSQTPRPDEKSEAIDNEQCVTFWFHNSSSRNFYITERFAEIYADTFFQEASPFADDPTINYCAIFNINKKREIVYMNEFGCELGYAIYGATYKQLETACVFEPGLKKIFIERDKLYDYLSQEEAYKVVLEHLYYEMGLPVDYSRIPDIQNYKPNSNNGAIIKEAFLGQSISRYRELIEDLKQIKKEIYVQLIQEGILIPKWKTEYDLYCVAKTLYPDSVFQYGNKVLGGQSIDIFIPSLNIGIEYQGVQHYKPVSIFGGEEGFNRTKERDARKLSICKANGIRLLYWKYDEPISGAILVKKIKSIL